MKGPVQAHCPACANAQPGTVISQCRVCRRFQCELEFPALDLTSNGCGKPSAHAEATCDHCDRARKYSVLHFVARIDG